MHFSSRACEFSNPPDPRRRNARVHADHRNRIDRIFGLYGLPGCTWNAVAGQERGGMLFSDSHILSTILFTPLVGAILMLFIPRTNANAHRLMGNLFGLLGLAVSLPLLWRFKFAVDAPIFQFLSSASTGFPRSTRTISLGIDGHQLLDGDADHGARRDRESFFLVGDSQHARKNITSCFCCCRPACSAFSCRSISCCSTSSGK